MVRALIICGLLGHALTHAHASAVSINPDNFLECDDPIVYLDKNKTLVASGSARLRSGSMILLADEMRWDRSINQIEASGSVVMTVNETRMLADKLSYNLNSGSYEALGVRRGIGPIVFDAGEITQKDGMTSFSEVEAYWLEPHVMDPALSFSMLQYDKNSSLVALREPSLLFRNNISVNFPDLSFSHDQSLIKPRLRAGKQSPLGWYAGVVFGQKRSQELSGNLELTAYRQRGFFISPDATWMTTQGDGYSDSIIKAGWIQDQGDDIGLDYRGRKISKDRGFLRLSSLHRINQRFRFAIQTEWDSDSEVYRDYRLNQFERNQWNESYGEFSYQGESFSISIFSSEQVNKHEGMVRHSPEINIHSGPFPFYGTYHTVDLNYADSSIISNAGNTEQSMEGFDLGYQVQHKLTIAEGIEYLPSLATKHQNYRFASGRQSRTLGEWGNDLIVTFQGKHSFESKTWELQEIAHTMRFSLGHRRVVGLSGGDDFLVPSALYSMENINLEPGSLLEDRESGKINQSEVIRLGWMNAWSGKWGKGYRKLASARFFYDIWENNRFPEKETHPLYSEISFTPAPWVDLTIRSKLDPKSGKNYRQGAGINILDGRFQETGISYYHYLDQGEFLQFETTRLLNEKLRATATITYDIKKESLPLWSLGVSFRPGWSWVWECSLSERKGTSKENDLALNFGIRLANF